MDANAHIKQYISQNILFGDQGFAYDDDASFLEQGILDSLGFMELVAFVEKEFGFRAGPEEVIPDNFDSVNKLVRYVESKRVPNRSAHLNACCSWPPAQRSGPENRQYVV
jgi:acyl carrier protein